MAKISARQWVLVVGSALLQLLPFPLAGPVPYWRRLFCWFCLAPLFYVLTGGSESVSPLNVKRAGFLGYVCGVVWYIGNCYWIFPTMHTYGALASPVAAGILVLFALYLGLYHALFAAVVAWVRLRWSSWWALAIAPFAWVAVELARARITGFPWDLLGYAQVDNFGFARLATVTGVMGLSLVIAIVNALWLVRGRAGWTRWAGPAVASVCVVVLGGVLAAKRIEAPVRSESEAVLLQDNLSVGAETSPVKETREQLLTDLTRRTEMAAQQLPAGEKTGVILWPEAPSDLLDGDPQFRQAASSLAAQLHAPVIAETVTIDQKVIPGEQPKLYNSASFFAADGSYSGRYDKMHLVPFGEYTPYKDILFFAGHLLDNVGGFTPGMDRTVFRTGGHSYGVFICYESIFGDEIRELAENGADVLVNLSDDGWYGNSSAPWEHLDMARMRAIENDRWVLRSTNTGVTTAIDPEGRLGVELPRHERGALVAGFGYVQGTTFYTRHGDWLAWLCVIVAGAGCAAPFARRWTVH